MQVYSANTLYPTHARMKIRFGAENDQDYNIRQKNIEQTNVIEHRTSPVPLKQIMPEILKQEERKNVSLKLFWERVLDNTLWLGGRIISQFIQIATGADDLIKDDPIELVPEVVKQGGVDWGADMGSSALQNASLKTRFVNWLTRFPGAPTGDKLKFVGRFISPFEKAIRFFEEKGQQLNLSLTKRVRTVHDVLLLKHFLNNLKEQNPDRFNDPEIQKYKKYVDDWAEVLQEGAGRKTFRDLDTSTKYKTNKNVVKMLKDTDRQIQDAGRAIGAAFGISEETLSNIERTPIDFNNNSFTGNF